MWVSLPLWKQKHFHLGLPYQSTGIFCIISLIDTAVFGVLILAMRLSPILFSPWKLFFLYCPEILHVLTPPLTPSPVARIQEGSSAPGSAGGSRWQQQSMLGAVSSKISDRKQRGSQEAGIWNITGLFFFAWHISGSDFFPQIAYMFYNNYPEGFFILFAVTLPHMGDW